MKKLYRFIPFLLIVAIGILSIRLFVVFVPKKAGHEDTNKGLSYIRSLENIGGNEADNLVKKAREKYEGAEQRKKIAAAIKEGNYEYAFKDVLIVGDSIMRSIFEYGILDQSQVFAEIGAGTAYLEDMTDDIIAANPKILILHFGENQLSGEDNAAAYAKEYGALIAALKKELPDTKIYVDSIFPVSEATLAAEPYLNAIGAYNKAIEAMTKEVGVNYIDYDPMWASFDKNYYDLDGIHPVSAFYSEQFLPYVLTEVGLSVD